MGVSLLENFEESHPKIRFPTCMREQKVSVSMYFHVARGFKLWCKIEVGPSENRFFYLIMQLSSVLVP